MTQQNLIYRDNKILKFALFIIISLHLVINARSEEFNKNTYNTYISNKDYESAWKYISSFENTSDSNLLFQKGMLQGSGLLKSGINTCLSVYFLEQAEEAGAKYVRGSLDYIYGGKWSSIAALEGNAKALYEVGIELLNAKVSNNGFLALDRDRSARDAYRYFRASSQLGYQPASQKLMQLKNSLDIAEEKIPDLKLMKILCPIRKPLGD